MLAGNSQVLCLNDGSWACSCGKWQITGIPCEHAYAAIMDVNKPVEEFVSPFFSTLGWKEQYDTAPEPVRGQKFWMNNSYVLITAPPKPKLPGREKGSKNNNRIKGKLESPKKKKKKSNPEVEVLKVSRKGRVMHCKQCGEANHNAAGCKKFPKENTTKDNNKELHEYLLTLSQIVAASSQAETSSSSHASTSSQVPSSQAPSSQEPASSQAPPQPSQQEQGDED